MNVQEVSVISSEQFAALTAAPEAPEVATDVALPEPEVQEEAVEQPDVQAEEAPVLETPEIPRPPSEDVAVLAPEISEDPVPQQADRVAPVPTEEPDPEAVPDPELREEISEDVTGEVQQEAQEATAPEETTTELVTEADTISAGPSQSLRPRARPNRPEPQPEPEPETTAETDAPAEDNTADAIAEAVAAAQRPNVPLGPPLTGREMEGLRVAVGSCWNVGTLSTEAQETKVTVFVALARDGKPDPGSIRMVTHSGGSESAARRVFDTARRAILRCGARGFPLPPEKYGRWREIEMTFDPEGMFWR